MVISPIIIAFFNYEIFVKCRFVQILSIIIFIFPFLSNKYRFTLLS